MVHKYFVCIYKKVTSKWYSRETEETRKKCKLSPLTDDDCTCDTSFTLSLTLLPLCLSLCLSLSLAEENDNLATFHCLISGFRRKPVKEAQLHWRRETERGSKRERDRDTCKLHWFKWHRDAMHPVIQFYIHDESLCIFQCHCKCFLMKLWWFDLTWLCALSLSLSLSPWRRLNINHANEFAFFFFFFFIFFVPLTLLTWFIHLQHYSCWCRSHKWWKTAQKRHHSTVHCYF